MKEEGHWADVFPHLKNSATEDPRIFQTPWEKLPDKTKKKTYFACIVGREGNNCYGVDVIKPWAVSAKNECAGAFAKVKMAVYYYEDNGIWPDDSLKNKKAS